MRNRTLSKFLKTFAAVLVLGALAAATPAQAIALKKNSIIRDTKITVGDVFENLPHSEDKVLGPAPLPGKDMVLNARTLLRIALALDLPWQPASSGDYVILKRAATLIDRPAIEEALKQKITENGMSGQFNFMIPDDEARIILPEDQPPTMEITSFDVDTRLRRFSAEISAPSAAVPLQTIRVSGRFEKLIDIPVLRESINPGMIIGVRDIDFIQMAEHSLNQEIALNGERLVGMTPRRLLVAGQPVKLNDIEAPQAVKRGQFVTMIYRTGALYLTAKGKALENGAQGDIVRVVNMASNKTLEGVVTAQGEVNVNDAL